MAQTHWLLQYIILAQCHIYVCNKTILQQSPMIILVCVTVLCSKCVLLPPNRTSWQDPTTSPSSPSSSPSVERCDPACSHFTPLYTWSSVSQWLDDPQQTATRIYLHVQMPSPIMHTGGHYKVPTGCTCCMGLKQILWNLIFNVLNVHWVQMEIFCVSCLLKDK